MRMRNKYTKKTTSRSAVLVLLGSVMVVGSIFGSLYALEKKEVPKVEKAELSESEGGKMVKANATTKYLVSCVTSFRQQASADFAQTVKNFDAESAFAFITGSKTFANSPLAWEYFFSAAVPMVGRIDNSAYVVVYYNPFMDAAILARWEMVEGPKGPRARISAASLMMGEQLAPGKRAEKPGHPRWLTAKKAPAFGLTDQFDTFRTEFTRQFPPDGSARWFSVAATPPDLVDKTAARMTITLIQLYAFQQKVNPKVVKLLNRFRTALYDGDAEELGRLLPKESILSGEEVAKLPKQFREQSVALYALGSKDEVMLILGDPNLLRFCGVLRYSITPPGKLADFSMFDMQSSPSDKSTPKAD